MSELFDAHIVSLLAIMGAVSMGIVSPGPSFVLVSRVAIARSRVEGLAAAFGMGAGGLVFATLAVAGLAALLESVGWLYAALRVAGGLYLAFVAVMIWRGANRRVEAPEAADGRSGGVGDAGGALRRAFALGFVTQVANPKTIVVYASIFVSLLPADAPTWLLLVLPPIMAALELLWYALVALVFSDARPRRAYLRLKPTVDRLAAGILGALGLRLVWDGARAA